MSVSKVFVSTNASGNATTFRRRSRKRPYQFQSADPVLRYNLPVLNSRKAKAESPACSARLRIGIPSGLVTFAHGGLRCEAGGRSSVGLWRLGAIAGGGGDRQEAA